MGHIGYCIAGELVVKMTDTGESKHIGEGDFFEIPPRHDAYVPGEQRCELVLFAAPEPQGR